MRGKAAAKVDKSFSGAWRGKTIKRISMSLERKIAIKHTISFDEKGEWREIVGRSEWMAWVQHVKFMCVY